MEPQEEGGTEKHSTEEERQKKRKRARLESDRAKQRMDEAVLWLSNTAKTLYHELRGLNSPQADFTEYRAQILLVIRTDWKARGEIMRNFVVKGLHNTEAGSDLRDRFLAIQSGIEEKMKELQDAESNLAIASANAQTDPRQ